MIRLCKPSAKKRKTLQKEKTYLRNGSPANIASGLGFGRGFLRIGLAPILTLMFWMTFSATGSARYAPGPYFCRWSRAMRLALVGDAQGCSLASSLAPFLRSLAWTVYLGGISANLQPHTFCRRLAFSPAFLPVPCRVAISSCSYHSAWEIQAFIAA